MSVFRKYTPGAGVGGFQRKSSLPGTKSWVYGQSLLSTGCGDLDNACGTGIPLGSIMVVSEEVGIHQASVLGRLFIAEGIHSKQRVLVISSQSREAVSAYLAKLPSIRGKEGGSEKAVGVNGSRSGASIAGASPAGGANRGLQMASSRSIPSQSTPSQSTPSRPISSQSTPSQSTPSQPTAKPRAWQYGKYLSNTSKTTPPFSCRSNGSHSLRPLLRPQPERNQQGAARQRRLPLRR